MNIEEFRTGLDYLFEQNRISEVEPYLESALRNAIEESDDAAVIFILNEMIGYYRETCDHERSVMYGEKALAILESTEEAGSIHYATTLINLANALRAAGRLEESVECYVKAEAIYKDLLVPEAFDFASLYNNMSLVYQEAGMFMESITCLNRAMETVLMYPEKRFELAVTHANLGNSLIGAYRSDPSIADTHPDLFDGIKSHLETAVAIFIERNENGAHLAAAINGLGDLNFIQGNDEEAIKYYYDALRAIENNLGRIDYYYRVKENYDLACSRLYDRLKEDSAKETSGEESVKVPDLLLDGKTLSRMYYEEVVKPLIEKDFPELIGAYSAGLFGEGSDAYGYDDTASRDHDWGPGVILLINNNGFYDQYGQQLRDALIKKAREIEDFHGFTPDISSVEKGRRGVFGLHSYFSALIGKELTDHLIFRPANIDPGYLYDMYAAVPEYSLSAAVNGEVFEDPDRLLTSVREGIKEFYPKELRIRKLMQECAMFSQNAQYNYLRSKRRNDSLTADMLLFEGMKNAMRIAHIIADVFTPHDKWMKKSLHNIDPEAAKLIENVITLSHKAPDTDPTDAMMRPVMDAIDRLAAHLQEKMIADGLISTPRRYMEDVIMQLSQSKEDLVKRVVKDEWDAFDKVINEGGRADCQDNWNTFNIMRSSQYLTWDKEMLLKYAEDFEASVAAGWNPIMEKYGRMEESTAPDRYEKIKDSLPPVPEQKKAIIEEIVRIQVGWMEEFAKEYPKMAGNARTIHTSEDTPYDTSYETYLRGELMTYSDEMLSMYGAFIVDLARKEENLARMTMENTALLYGYKSLDDAEGAL